MLNYLFGEETGIKFCQQNKFQPCALNVLTGGESLMCNAALRAFLG